MENKKSVFLAVSLVGFVLVGLSLCFPWFVFSGLANFQNETFTVSGEVLAFGFGRNSYGAQVCVWSLVHGWNTASTDFWYGYLVLCGLILLVVATFFAVAKKTGVSLALALASSAIVISALALSLSYRPATFVFLGSVPTSQGFKVGLSRLYSEQATVNIGVGFLFSLFGSLVVLLGSVIMLLRRVKKSWVKEHLQFYRL